MVYGRIVGGWKAFGCGELEWGNPGVGIHPESSAKPGCGKQQTRAHQLCPGPEPRLIELGGVDQPPVSNPTNINDQVSLALTNASSFFRLVTQ
jgi:hypothetical protein